METLKNKILLFNQEKIELLPSVNECDKLIVGEFAKINKTKNKSQLVFVTVNETVGKNVGTVCYFQCNPYNGEIHNSEWSETYVKSTYSNGGEFWKSISNNLQPITIFN